MRVAQNFGAMVPDETERGTKEKGCVLTVDVVSRLLVVADVDDRRKWQGATVIVLTCALDSLTTAFGLKVKVLTAHGAACRSPGRLFVQISEVGHCTQG